MSKSIGSRHASLESQAGELQDFRDPFQLREQVGTLAPSAFQMLEEQQREPLQVVCKLDGDNQLRWMLTIHGTAGQGNFFAVPLPHPCRTFGGLGL